MPSAEKAKLAKLCRYYLDCLAAHNDAGISVSQHGADYAEVQPLPFREIALPELLTRANANRLVSAVRQAPTKLVLSLGYPTSLRNHAGQNVVEPVFLFPINIEGGAHGGPPRLADGLPDLNVQVLRSHAMADGGNILEELALLEDELGYNRPPLDLPNPEDVLRALPLIRPSWDWKEAIDPDDLSSGLPISELEQPGIYNRAIIVMSDRSKYTQGLETDLQKLAGVDDAQLQRTALGDWLAGTASAVLKNADSSLLEVFPLNLEQRNAVNRALVERLTVITGPPGTGKSQIVTEILLNCAWLGKRVLLASKNNKAVDVVRTRINGIGPRPILLQLGSQQHMASLAVCLTALLAATTSDYDKAEYDRAVRSIDDLKRQLSDLNHEAESMIGCLNELVLLS